MAVALIVTLWLIGALAFWHSNRSLFDQRTEWAWSLLWPILAPMIVLSERHELRLVIASPKGPSDG